MPWRACIIFITVGFARGETDGYHERAQGHRSTSRAAPSREGGHRESAVYQRLESNQRELCWYACRVAPKTVLILGGVDKGNDYSEIEELVRRQGHSSFRKIIADFTSSSMEGRRYEMPAQWEAVDAVTNGSKGDTVLLRLVASFTFRELRR